MSELIIRGLEEAEQKLVEKGKEQSNKQSVMKWENHRRDRNENHLHLLNLMKNILQNYTHTSKNL